MIEMIIGFMVEDAIGSYRMILFYVFTSVGGNLFACLMQPTPSFGPEPFLIGLMTSLIAMVVIYWDRLGENGRRKICFLFIIVIFMLFGIMFLNSMQEAYYPFYFKYNVVYPDLAGALGMFLFGIMAAFMIIPSKEFGFL